MPPCLAFDLEQTTPNHFKQVRISAALVNYVQGGKPQKPLHQCLDSETAFPLSSFKVLMPVSYVLVSWFQREWNQRRIIPNLNFELKVSFWLSFICFIYLFFC